METNRTKSAVRWIGTIAFLDLFAVSLAVPILSTHMRSLGASHFLSGVISSLYSALQLLTGPIVGSWSDIRGRRAILLVTLPLCAICYVFLGIATTITIVIFARVGLGLMKHTQTLGKALVSDLVPGPRQAQVNGTISAVSGAGFIIGPIIGGHLSELDGGFRYVCFIVAALFCINLAITYTCIPASQAPRDTRRASLRSEAWKAVTELAEVDWATYWDVFALKFLLGFTMAVFFTEYSISMQDKFQLTPKHIGYTIAFQGLVGSTAGMSIRYVEQIYTESKDRSLQTFHGFLLMCLSFLLTSFASNLVFFIFCLIPIASCSSLLRIVTMETMLRRTPKDKHGSLIGSSGSIMSVTRMLAPTCAGLVRDAFGSDGISVLTVASAGVGTCLAAVVMFRNGRKTKEQ